MFPRAVELRTLELPTSASAASRDAAVTPEKSAIDPELQEILKKVSAARHLPILRPVTSKSLSRDALLTKLREKIAKEIPAGVIALQGESLRLLELVPTDYDFEAGILKLLQGRIAGLYDPDDQTMYLLDDLPESLKEETLNHELVHALQDQSFNLAPMLKFRPGKGDPTTAVQLLIEGDATNAMFEVGGSSSLDIDEGTLRTLFLVSTRLSADGLTTPSILQSSLISPYTDGFSFVQGLRRKGSWSAVDTAFHHLPETTEQALHVDKFLAREPAIPVADPTLASLEPGFVPAFVDSMGELGLREMLEEWQARTVAKTAAAGWGGDRYVVAQRSASDGSVETAVAYHIRMDSSGDAAEVGAILSSALGRPKRASSPFCKERPMLGPVAWTVVGADVAIVAGPYTSSNGVKRSASTCSKALLWLDETRGAAPQNGATAATR